MQIIILILDLTARISLDLFFVILPSGLELLI